MRSGVIKMRTMSNCNLLVVDDDEAVRDFLTEFLASIGFNVTTFESAEAAMKLTEHELNQLEVVITDYDMPGIDGLQFARHVKRINPHVQLIVMSGKIQEIASEVSELGTTLRKPFSLPTLVDQLPDPLLPTVT